MADRWFLGRTSPKKVIHTAECRYALTEYRWAAPYGSNWSLAVALVNTGAHRWHKACLHCCPGLDSAMRAAADGPLASDETAPEK